MVSPLDTATDLAKAIRHKDISSRELLETYLSRIDVLNPSLNAVVTVDAERALAEAARVDAETAKGEFRGPLHGLPCTIKDSIAVGGMLSTGGAPEYASHIPAEDAPAVAALRRAGAVVFGKTNVPRWASDYQTYNDVFGVTNNPWDLSRTPGGSSGGAAVAVAAGLTAFELGTDIAGSIRIPSNFCGIAGHKSSHGIVPDQGYLHYVGSGRSSTDISVLGPLARSVGDLELILDAVAGPAPREAAAWRLELPAAPSRPWRVGTFFADESCPVRSDVRRTLQEAAAALAADGAQVDESRPDITFEDAGGVFLPLLMGAVALGIDGELGKHLGGQHIDWLRHQDARQGLRDRWAQWFAGHDVLLMPAFPVPAFAHDTELPFPERTLDIDGVSVSHPACAQWLGYVGIADLPSTVVRIGTSRDGLPIGIQVVGRYLGDRTALAVAARLESLLGGYQTPPMSENLPQQ